VQAGDWREGVEILEPLVTTLGQNAPRRAMLGLLQGYEHSGAYAQALRLCGTLMARAVDDGVDGQAGLMLRHARSRCLVALSRSQEAELQWRDYLGSLSDDASADLRAGALCALATLALARGDKALARAHLEHATSLDAACAQTRQALIDAWQAAEQYDRVVALRLREAETADSPQKRAQHLLAAAYMLEEHLDDKAEASWLLEQACEATPRDPGLLQQLMQRYAQAGDTTKKLLCAERLMTLNPSDYFGADFFFDLAQSYSDIDPVRAAAMAKKALDFDPAHRERQALCRKLYAAAADWRAYADLEQALVPDLEDATQRGPRAAALAEVYIEQLGDTGRGLSALRMACAACPTEPAYWRRRASLLAQTPSSFSEATDCYRRLLEQAPTDTTILRILARLTGAQGAMDKAYGYYACLLCLVPEDDEAERFVMACRKNRRAKDLGLSAASLAPVLQARVPDALVGLLEDVGTALNMAAVPVAQPVAHAIVKSVHCDIEESLAALMQMRGLSAETHQPQHLIETSDEARELFVFAQSLDYFALRADLGIAIAAGTA
jgi:tetratricopeptide (TPR) repeat protein